MTASLRDPRTDGATAGAVSEPDETPPARRPLWWVAGPGVVVGAVSGAWGLAQVGLWLDEAYSLGATNQLGETLSRTHGTMAAYYVLLTGWLSVSSSVLWMRALSVVLAVTALVAAAAVARRLVDDRQAQMAMLLTPLTFLWLVYAREARSYALVLLLTSVAWLAVDHGIADDEPRARRWWAVHTAVVAVMPLAHGLALLQVLPAALVLLAGGAGRTTWLRFVRGVTLGLVVTGFLTAVGASEVGNWVAPLSVGLVTTSLGLVTGPLAPLAVLVGVVLVTGIIAVARRVAAAPAGLERARALVPFAWGVVPFLLLILVSVVRPSLVPRYVLGSVPGLGLLMAAAIEWVADHRPGARFTCAAVVVAVLSIGHLDVHDLPADGWTTSAELVATESRPGDTLLLVDDESRPPFESAWRAAGADHDLAVVAGDRPLGEVLRYEPDERSHPERWDRAGEASGRVWVVGDAHTDPISAAVDAVEASGDHVVIERRTMPDSTIEVVLLDPAG